MILNNVLLNNARISVVAEIDTDEIDSRDLAECDAILDALNAGHVEVPVPSCDALRVRLSLPESTHSLPGLFCLMERRKPVPLTASLLLPATMERNALLSSCAAMLEWSGGGANAEVISRIDTLRPALATVLLREPRAALDEWRYSFPPNFAIAVLRRAL